MTKTMLVNLRTYRGPDYTPIDRRMIFGNPFRISSQRTCEESVRLFEKYFKRRIRKDVVFRTAVKALRGQRLACWCTPLVCHGDVYVSYLESLK